MFLEQFSLNHSSSQKYSVTRCLKKNKKQKKLTNQIISCIKPNIQGTSSLTLFLNLSLLTSYDSLYSHRAYILRPTYFVRILFFLCSITCSLFNTCWNLSQFGMNFLINLCSSLHCFYSLEFYSLLGKPIIWLPAWNWALSYSESTYF